MDKIVVDPARAYSLINAGNVIVISVGDSAQDNLYTVAWNMPVKKEPATIAFVSSQKHYSYEIIKRTGQFGINVPTADMVDAVLGCGSISGRGGVDKFAKFNLTRKPATKIKPPLIKEAFANLECGVVQVIDIGTSALILGHVFCAQVQSAHYQNDQITFENGLSLLHHLGGTRFCASNELILGKKPT